MIKIYSKTEMTLLIPDRMEGLLPDGGGLSLGGGGIGLERPGGGGGGRLFL